VTGVETNSGPVGADLVVGADGRNSTVARLTGAREYGTAPAGRLFMWGYFRGVPKRDGQIMLARIDDLGYLASPTDNGLYLAAVAPDVSRKREYMADRERSLREGIRRWPELHEIVGDAELEGPVHTVGSWHGFFRESAGPGWVLVGDAGQFKDPTPGQGISDSLRHSARLSDAIVGGLRGGSAAMDAQLQRWWSWRDRDSREIHWLATDLGKPGVVTPVREAVFAAIAAEPDASRNFIRVMNHDVRPSRVFTARRMFRAAGRLLGTQPHRRREVVGEVGELIGNTVRQARLRRPRRTSASPLRDDRHASQSETAAASA
jgi:2-polyprenyl-6-methoxyphenol hydroxylase-like FAD-dependent oxidoreductase